ncbi:MAG: DUF4157 domain-containing protein [Actinobacteria bacterium]|nr:DUF4157 domain-containing protein [Actinomycetota bacterium]
MASSEHVQTEQPDRASGPSSSRESTAEGPTEGTEGASVVARTAGAPLDRRTLLAMQRTAGNRAAAQVAGRRAPSSGLSLPGDSDAARRILGSSASEVRIHTGTDAAAAAGDALAMTDGYDIHLGAGAPAPTSPEGRALLAHEAAHVVQQTRAGVTVSRQQAEESADAAMLAAVSGRPIPDLPQAQGPHFFEARWHQATLTNAMEEAGFSDQEQEEAYFANWCRDVSQAFVPASERIGHSNVMTILNAMSQLKFGRSVSAKEMGSYSRREHIDAPAGQITAGGPAGMEFGGDLPEVRENLPGRGDIESPEDDLSPERMAALYQVDASGVPAYIYESRDYIEEQAQQSIEHIRSGERGQALGNLGNLSHTIQDLFAHSNWVEAAIGKLIQDEDIQLNLSDEFTPANDQEQAAVDNMRERQAANQPLIENYAAEIRTGAEEVRPILMTGTFSGSLGEPGHDTLISLKHELEHVLASHSPFKEGGTPGDAWWDLAIELLDSAEESADAGALGEIFVGSVEEVLANTSLGRRVDSLLQGVTGVTGGLEGQARGQLGQGVLGDVAAWGARQVHGAATAVASDWRQPLRDVVARVVNTAFSDVTWAKLLVYYQKGEGVVAGAWEALKEAVRGLPAAVRALILPKLAEAERKFKEQVRRAGEAAWNRAVGTVLSMISDQTQTTNVAETSLQVKLERFQKALPELRDNLLDAIDRLAPDDRKADLRQTLKALPLPKVVGFLSSPAFQQALGSLDAERQQELAKAGREFAETDERRRQIEALPEWARAGPSHSQIAKDHATSPFFGAAFAMANAADRLVVRAVRRAWVDAGYQSPTGPEGQDFGELPPEGEEASDDQYGTGLSTLEQERRRRFLETRRSAQEVLERGHGDIALPGRELAAIGDQLETYIVTLEEQVPGARVAFRGLLEALRRTATGEVIIAELDRGQRWLREQADYELEERTTWTERQRWYRRIEQLMARVRSVVQLLSAYCRPDESHADHAAHQGLPEGHRDETLDEHAQHAGRPDEHAQESPEQHAAHASRPPGHETETPQQHAPHLKRPPGHEGETPAEHARHNPDTEVHYGRQIDTLDRFRGASPLKPPEVGQLPAGHLSERADRRKRLEAAQGAERALLEQIRTVFGHPYDTTWWRETLIGWSNRNRQVLAQYVIARNEGRAGSHAH